MRCREAGLIMDRLAAEKLPLESDPKLKEHLDNCSECAERARLAGYLSAGLKMAKADDDSHIIPAEIMRQRLEATVQHGAARQTSRAKTPVFPLVRRLVLGAVPAVVTLILVLSVIPVSHNHITGWQVALEGVSLDMAEDDHVICEMLFDMGLMEAAVDIIGCDSTCNLLIFDLKTRTEAQMVASVFHAIDSVNVSTDVVPVRSSTKRSLWQRVNEGILNP